MLLTPDDIVLDYASTIADPATLNRMVAAGVKAVVRYISVSPTGPSDIQSAEVTALFAAGLGLWVVFEEFKYSSTGGRDAGILHGRSARANLIRLGYPFDVPHIVTAQDVGMNPTQYSSVIDYVAGYQQEVQWPGGLLLYGGTTVCRYVMAKVPGILGVWKAGAGAWSSPADADIVLVEQHFGYSHPAVQALGLNVDDNTVHKPVTVWDGKVIDDMAKMIRDPRSGEIDITDGNTRRDPALGVADVAKRLAIANSWAAVLGPWTDVIPEVWDNTPVWTPALAAAAAAPFPKSLSITLSGVGILS